ncbi:MAG: phosphodiesterase [Steroidobacteraceae bacterium]|nr:phosphodiesterase [Steroidobacteraceae bacterium]
MRLLQFTDTHLTGSPGMQIRGVATAATLERALAHAARRHPGPDAVLLTGDLVHDDAGGYAALRRCFGGFAAPVHCLPGNHDDPAALRRELAGPPFVHEFAMRRGRWLFVMLDSTVPGRDHGHLGRPQLQRLDAALAQHRDAHALVCLHHHPVPHGSRWLDDLMVDNAGELFDVLGRHAGVRGLAWGHTHQPLDAARGGIRLMGTPSTCMQFAQESPEFAVDARPPAYRWMKLGDDGGLETGVEWVDGDD